MPHRHVAHGFVDLEAVLERVELRDRLALTHHALVPEIDEFDTSLYADELNLLFPTDRVLRDLLAIATKSADDTRPEAITRVRSHLSETYRLHHRVLRTRRTPDIGETFQVVGVIDTGMIGVQAHEAVTGGDR